MLFVTLDIGCGYLPDHKRRSGIGIDLQRGTCDIQCDACHLPFKDNSFCQIQARNILEHIPNPFHLLREINRVLTPHGHCFISIPIRPHPCIDELVKICFGFPIRLTRTIQRLVRWTKHRRKQGFWHLNKISLNDILASRIVQVVGCKTIRPRHDILEGRKARVFQRLGVWAYYPPDVYLIIAKCENDGRPI